MRVGFIFPSPAKWEKWASADLTRFKHWQKLNEACLMISFREHATAGKPTEALVCSVNFGSLRKLDVSVVTALAAPKRIRWKIEIDVNGLRQITQQRVRPQEVVPSHWNLIPTVPDLVTVEGW